MYEYIECEEEESGQVSFKMAPNRSHNADLYQFKSEASRWSIFYSYPPSNKATIIPVVHECAGELWLGRIDVEHFHLCLHIEIFACGKHLNIWGKMVVWDWKNPRQEIQIKQNRSTWKGLWLTDSPLDGFERSVMEIQWCLTYYAQSNCWLWIAHPLWYKAKVVVVEGLDSFQLLTSAVQRTPVCKLNNIWYNKGLNCGETQPFKARNVFTYSANIKRNQGMRFWSVRVKRDVRILPSLIIRLILKNVTTSKN